MGMREFCQRIIRQSYDTPNFLDAPDPALIRTDAAEYNRRHAIYVGRKRRLEAAEMALGGGNAFEEQMLAAERTGGQPDDTDVIREARIQARIDDIAGLTDDEKNPRARPNRNR